MAKIHSVQPFQKHRTVSPCYDVIFTMEKQIVEYVPKDLAGKFKVGDKVWRI